MLKSQTEGTPGFMGSAVLLEFRYLVRRMSLLSWIVVPSARTSWRAAKKSLSGTSMRTQTDRVGDPITTAAFSSGAVSKTTALVVHWNMSAPARRAEPGSARYLAAGGPPQSVRSALHPVEPKCMEYHPAWNTVITPGPLRAVPSNNQHDPTISCGHHY